jgi:hypothetical protein
MTTFSRTNKGRKGATTYKKKKKKKKKGEKGGTTSLHMEIRIPDQSYSCPLSILTGTI